jgi:hypothetical protein
MDAGSKHAEMNFMSDDKKLSIYAPTLIAGVNLPYFDLFVDRINAVYATIQLNRLMDILYLDENSRGWSTSGYMINVGAGLVHKTLLIPKEFISPALSAVEIQKAYPYKLDICDFSKIGNAILSKDSTIAAVFFVHAKMGNYLVISDVEDGDIYGVVDANKWAIPVNIFGTLGETKKNTWLINKKELQEIGNCAR